MIMETEALIAQTNKAIQQIVRDNDLEMKNIRKKVAPEKKRRFAGWLLLVLMLVLLLLSYRLYLRYLI